MGWKKKRDGVMEIKEKKYFNEIIRCIFFWILNLFLPSKDLAYEFLDAQVWEPVDGYSEKKIAEEKNSHLHWKKNNIIKWEINL